MKIFNYNPNNYGQQFFIVAEDVNQANDKLLAYLKENITNQKYCFYKEKHKEWSGAFKKNTLPDSYTIDELDINKVIHTEIS